MNLSFFSKPQLFKQEEWPAFSNRGLHLIHLNINILLSKIEKLRYITKRTKAAVIGILEPKLDNTMKFFVSIEIETGEVLLITLGYIRSDINNKLNYFMPNEIENITFNILMLHTKPITAGIIYRPQISLNFLILLKKIYLNSTQNIVKFAS